LLVRLDGADKLQTKEEVGKQNLLGDWALAGALM
jgi:hypothetical protein